MWGKKRDALIWCIETGDKCKAFEIAGRMLDQEIFLKENYGAVFRKKNYMKNQEG